LRMAGVVASTADTISSIQAAVDGETHYRNMRAGRAATGEKLATHPFAKNAKKWGTRLLAMTN